MTVRILVLKAFKHPNHPSKVTYSKFRHLTKIYKIFNKTNSNTYKTLSPCIKTINIQYYVDILF